MLPSHYKCALALACFLPFATAWAQNPTGDERMRVCVGVLSKGLESGMSADDYPEQAKREGRTGTAQVQLAVSFTGKMENASIAQGSGDTELDQSAVTAARRIFPVTSPAPAQCRLGYAFTVTLAVVYKLLDTQ